jgi:recombination protein RecA
MYGVGIAKEQELLDLAVNAKIVEKSGAWYSYKESKIGQGKDKVVEFFKENPAVAEEIKQKLMSI